MTVRVTKNRIGDGDRWLFFKTEYVLVFVQTFNTFFAIYQYMSLPSKPGVQLLYDHNHVPKPCEHKQNNAIRKNAPAFPQNGFALVSGYRLMEIMDTITCFDKPEVNLLMMGREMDRCRFPILA